MIEYDLDVSGGLMPVSMTIVLVASIMISPLVIV